MSVESDLTDLSVLARDLGMLSSQQQTIENMTKAVETTARAVKETWNQKLPSEGHASRTSRAISYDVGVAHNFSLFATGVDPGSAPSSTIVAEIGARRGSGKQAGVVRLLENGSINNAPRAYGADSLHEHEGDFESALAFAEAAAAGRWNL